MRVVIALGGNAMTAPDGSARPDDQRAAIERAMAPVADVVAGGHEVLLTHGNGPQVGNLLVKNELAAAVVPPVGLDWCGAQTQGTIGVLIMNALARYDITRVATLVSRTLVDADDAGFRAPSKPIGRYLPADEAALMIEHGQVWQDRGARGWRRVVASPRPRACVDAGAAAALLGAGYVVTCSGGGGVPVVEDGHSGYRGVEAVIDKDLTAALLAITLDADALVIATDVEAAMVDWGTPQQRPLGHVDVATLRAHAAAGAFAGGSMGPKVEAVCRFAESTTATAGFAAITSLERIADAVARTSGTIVSRSKE